MHLPLRLGKPIIFKMSVGCFASTLFQFQNTCPPQHHKTQAMPHGGLPDKQNVEVYIVCPIMSRIIQSKHVVYLQY